MIQRIQTIWLLVAAVLAGLSFKLSFFSGNKLNATTNVKEWIEFTANQNIFTMILAVAIAVASLIAIFMFKDRKRQMLVTLCTGVVSIIQIFLYFNAKSTFTEANLDLGSLISFAIPACLMLASRAIYNDDKLVKIADRLR
ncbi:MAG: DUF4293 family protein [Sphingobacteriia bacterium]|nr:MAG: DUF4293 family protein [Sphingobacteriia bacterium]